MHRSSTLLTSVRARVRQAQLAVGVGFAAVVLGAVVVAPLAIRVAGWARGAEPAWLPELLGALISRLWLCALLPVLGLGLGRVADVKPWPTAIGAALTGEAFQLAMRLLTFGLEWIPGTWPSAVMHLATLPLGVLLSQRAIAAGRSWAAGAQERARAAAEARKAEYEAFTREAERMASRNPGEGDQSPRA